MDTQIVTTFNVIGISVRTTNENEQAMKDIPALWQKFMTEGISDRIPNKMNDTIYCIYTDYEKDHTQPYTTILGCQVVSLQEIPEGMSCKTIDEENYIKRTARGNIFQGMVVNEWSKIWSGNLPRAFTADFEVYGEKAQNLEDAEVDIFVSVK